jgi:hypothetical protein
MSQDAQTPAEKTDPDIKAPHLSRKTQTRERPASQVMTLVEALPATNADLKAMNRQLIPLRVMFLLLPIFCTIFLGWFLQSKVYLTLVLEQVGEMQAAADESVRDPE